MARGRKKGGLNVNSINDRNELTNMIINQINSLNKKIKAFKGKEIEEHEEYVKTLITDDMGQFTDSGTLSKSKKFYDTKNIVWLKKALTTLHKINNHEFFGTIRKYEKEVTKTIGKIQDFSKRHLREKGYSEEFIQNVVNSKSYLVQLLDAYKDVSPGFGSRQAIEKVALNYDENTGLSEKEMNKILNNIEYSRNTFERLTEEQQAVNEYRNSKRR